MLSSRFAIAFIKRKEEDDIEKSEQKQAASARIKIPMAKFLKVNEILANKVEEHM